MTRRTTGPRRLVARWMPATAMTLGAAVMMSSCALPGQGESSDDVYDRARDIYTAMAEELHEVIMAIEPTEWSVDEGQYGARPSGCQLGISEETGFSFTAVRVLDLHGRDPAVILTAAEAGFTAAGITPNERSAGDGPATRRSGESEVAATIVTVDPGTGRVRVSSRTDCEPGSAPEIAAIMFDEERYPADVWRRLPATEGPESVPQFFFPPDGPLYYDEAGEPVVPQPRVTVAPTPEG